MAETTTPRRRTRRTPQQERARHGWLSTRAFAEKIGASPDHVYGLVAAEWFRRDADPPECIDVALPGARRPEYRFSPAAVTRFLKERAR